MCRGGGVLTLPTAAISNYVVIAIGDTWETSGAPPSLLDPVSVSASAHSTAQSAVQTDYKLIWSSVTDWQKDSWTKKQLNNPPALQLRHQLLLQPRWSSRRIRPKLELTDCEDDTHSSKFEVQWIMEELSMKLIKNRWQLHYYYC